MREICRQTRVEVVLLVVEMAIKEIHRVVQVVKCIHNILTQVAILIINEVAPLLFPVAKVEPSANRLTSSNRCSTSPTNKA